MVTFGNVFIGPPLLGCLPHSLLSHVTPACAGHPKNAGYVLRILQTSRRMRSTYAIHGGVELGLGVG